jgi:alpha-L-fucosidase
LQPRIVVTREALETPEQYVPGVPIEGAWEANLTMGTQWQYKPTNETYKSGTQLITTLIETRAKGGNLLLNIGPKPDGEIPIEQEGRLREIALWMFVNSESIYAVRPWVITNENDVWFTKRKDEDTVYAFSASKERWKYGEWREFNFRSIRSTPQTIVSVLGQSDRVLEYRPDVIPKTTWTQSQSGLHVRAMRAQRLYNDRTWPNPVVLKITHVEPAMRPPSVSAASAKWSPSDHAAIVTAELESMGEAPLLDAGFEFQHLRGIDINERATQWHATQFQKLSKPGKFSESIQGLVPGEAYAFRAVVKHPLVTIYSKDAKLIAK